jgi:hypothetical protein
VTGESIFMIGVFMLLFVIAFIGGVIVWLFRQINKTKK